MILLLYTQESEALLVPPRKDTTESLLVCPSLLTVDTFPSVIPVLDSKNHEYNGTDRREPGTGGISYS